MVVTRKVSIKRHILAIILAVLIFLTGISLGAFVNTERTEQLEEKTELSKLDFDSLQVQYLFLTSSLETEKSCLAAAVTLEENVNLLEVLGNKLTKYIRDQVLTD
ncbi:MAG: hypothetical protein L6408_06500, partial [Nanoarchaeota archaeon]|nr:hypothetical protein [Nanoarchaeota archaeon]